MFVLKIRFVHFHTITIFIVKFLTIFFCFNINVKLFLSLLLSLLSKGFLKSFCSIQQRSFFNWAASEMAKILVDWNRKDLQYLSFQIIFINQCDLIKSHSLGCLHLTFQGPGFESHNYPIFRVSRLSLMLSDWVDFFLTSLGFNLNFIKYNK